MGPHHPYHVGPPIDSREHILEPIILVGRDPECVHVWSWGPVFQFKGWTPVGSGNYSLPWEIVDVAVFAASWRLLKNHSVRDVKLHWQKRLWNTESLPSRTACSWNSCSSTRHIRLVHRLGLGPGRYMHRWNPTWCNRGLESRQPNPRPETYTEWATDLRKMECWGCRHLELFVGVQLSLYSGSI